MRGLRLLALIVVFCCLWVQERGARDRKKGKRRDEKGGRYGYYNTMAGACEL